MEMVNEGEVKEKSSRNILIFILLAVLVFVGVLIFAFLVVLVAVGFDGAYDIYLDVVCDDKNIPIELIDVKTGDKNITFTYKWTGDNNNLTLIAAKYQPFIWVEDGVTYKPESDFREFNDIQLFEDDMVSIEHILTNFIEFKNWDGDETLIFKHTDNEKCIQEEVAGVYYQNQ